jgi:hypothetical protein
MRWKSRIQSLSNCTREVTKFLIFPKCLDGQWRWLEKTSYIQKGHECYTEGSIISYWEDVHWSDLDKR